MLTISICNGSNSNEIKITHIRPDNKYYSAYFGETIILPCHVENLKQSTVIWQYIKNPLPVTLTVGLVQYKTDYRVRLVTNLTSEDAQKWDLEIRKLKLEDEGNYLCRITNNGVTLKRVIYLKVLVRMAIDPINPQVYFKESLTLNCNTSYMQNADNERRSIFTSNIGTFEWFKNNESNSLNYHHDMSNHSNYMVENFYSPTFSSQLIILHIKSSNIATYTCRFRSQNVSTTLKKATSKFDFYKI